MSTNSLRPFGGIGSLETLSSTVHSVSTVDSPGPALGPSTEDLSRSLVFGRGLLVPGSCLSLSGVAVILMLIRPVSENLQLAVILGFGVFVAVLRLMAEGWKASKQVTLWWLAALSVGVLGTLVGALRGNPGWAPEAVFYVALPVVFFLIIAAAGPRLLLNVFAAIPVGLSLAALHSIAYFAYTRGWIGFDISSVVDLGYGLGNVGTDEAGRIEFGFEIGSWSISSLVFFPAAVAILLFNIHFKSRLSEFFRWPAVVLSLIFLLISGRRGIIMSTVVVMVALLLVVIWRRAASDQQRSARSWLAPTAVLLGLFLLASAALSFSPSQFLEQATSSNDVRRGPQLVAFLDSIEQSPLIGQGFGNVLEGWVANFERPWQYELQYFLLANAVGLVGFAAIATVTAALYVGAFRVAREGAYGLVVLSLLAGTTSILAANFTNPYLHTAGNYWMFYVLVLAVDVGMRQPRPFVVEQVALTGPPELVLLSPSPQESSDTLELARQDIPMDHEVREKDSDAPSEPGEHPVVSKGGKASAAPARSEPCQDD